MEGIDFSKLTSEDIINNEELEITQMKKLLIRLAFERRGGYDPTIDTDWDFGEAPEDWGDILIMKYTGCVNYATKLSYYVDKFDNLITFKDEHTHTPITPCAARFALAYSVRLLLFMCVGCGGRRYSLVVGPKASCES